MKGASEARDEMQMIASILAGQSHYFHDLIRPYERGVYAMTLSLLHNEAEAEDAAQETFLKAFRNLAAFRSEAKFSTWLIAIALNEARSRLQRAKTWKMESLDEPADEGSQATPALLRDWREIPSETLERGEVRTILRDAIAALPAIYRQVFLLREVEDFSVEETAASLGVTTASVKVRLHRARLMLQKKLAPQLKKISPSKRRWLPWS